MLFLYTVCSAKVGVPFTGPVMGVAECYPPCLRGLFTCRPSRVWFCMYALLSAYSIIMVGLLSYFPWRLNVNSQSCQLIASRARMHQQQPEASAKHMFMSTTIQTAIKHTLKTQLGTFGRLQWPHQSRDDSGHGRSPSLPCHSVQFCNVPSRSVLFCAVLRVIRSAADRVRAASVSSPALSAGPNEASGDVGS